MKILALGLIQCGVVVRWKQREHHSPRRDWEDLPQRYNDKLMCLSTFVLWFSSFQSRRFPRKQVEVLGPGSHNPQPVENRVDFNRAGASSNFQKPIAVKPDDKSDHSHSFPAPNAYNLSDVQTGKKNLITAEAAFKSKTKRDTMSLHAASNPAPCQYTVQDQLMHQSASPHQSVFKSKTIRGDVTKPKKVITRHIARVAANSFYCGYSQNYFWNILTW